MSVDILHIGPQPKEWVDLLSKQIPEKCLGCLALGDRNGFVGMCPTEVLLMSYVGQDHVGLFAAQALACNPKNPPRSQTVSSADYDRLNAFRAYAPTALS